MSVSVGPAVDVSYDNDWPYEEQKKTGGSSELAAIINSIGIGREVRGRPLKAIPGADGVKSALVSQAALLILG